VVKGGVTTSYTYGADGLRTQKQYGSTTYNYYYVDGRLVRMTWANSYIDFLYDESGSVYSFVYDGDQYYFVKNLQGDVVQIRSIWGTLLVEYDYDAWGNCTVVYEHSSYGDLAEKITAVKNGIGVAGVWIIAILMIISLVIVSNTIRVTMYNRKLEISIMKAVGATDTFVRIPFVVEGVLIGIISALISEGLLYFCYRVATETIITTLGTSDIVKYSDMAWILLLVFLGIGVFAGILGSFIMISKYLRREGSEFAAI
jgi:ABC-type antimicrobial peptide transport system permease subunit